MPPRAHERFASAVRKLAIGRGGIQERIADALREVYRAQNDGDLSIDFALEIQRFERQWNASQQSQGEGQIEAWAMGLPDDKAVEIADWIVSAEYQLRQE